ncbi:uncharacterized protein HMPREF1541_00245 [Cyphellophora europaea CBS 101466]|uniref:NYN domain-containing protein n=1 Tax=Cyphellophora europaea (strain CBS 101466) TaxID=1220924 RepID=W2SBE8_CYPE1|nr:uncharacterized protein HMPREF1541_00245 [Cyphellophora europaea CBS 101466]ETN46061.1 hypothetical protein HMPREF1541_00245 [Cyphellophora europaea CBS 101466]
MSEAEPIWDFDSAINLLNKFSLPRLNLDDLTHQVEASGVSQSQDAGGLGNFGTLWDFLGRPHTVQDVIVPEESELEKEPSYADVSVDGRAIRWRDEVDGADLEDNIEPPKPTAASLRTAKRAARRARARERAEGLSVIPNADTDTGTDYESAGEELEALRRSPNRAAVIDSILGRSRPALNDSPPTSPSPPKLKATPQRDWPVSNPSLWTAPGIPSPSHTTVIAPQDGYTIQERKQKLIAFLRKKHREQERFLKTSGLMLPEFTTLNTSSIGVHVFIDMSNISIGFHDCLKIARGIDRDIRVRRIPMDFHNFSLVLERGRPAAKRVLVGSDTNPAVLQAESLGYETNILERVHKAKELTPRQRKYAARSGGETSGSETNTGFTPRAAAKWVEQAVDEILHLKILESLIDTDKPSTIVLATGDAAEAEYSGGFLKMVERALAKGWMVELVSFKLNTSSMYLRPDFRAKWGPMFKWIQLDDYAEYLINGQGY